jgi:hypothetical protein
MPPSLTKKCIEKNLPELKVRAYNPRVPVGKKNVYKIDTG